MKNILRWIAVLPGAILGAIVVAIVAKYVINFWQDDWGLHWLERLYFYSTWAIISFIPPIAFVLAGMRIAPFYKRECGVFLCSILILYTIILFIIQYVENSNGVLLFNKKSVIYIISQFVGSILSFFFLPKNDEEFSKEWEK